MDLILRERPVLYKNLLHAGEASDYIPIPFKVYTARKQTQTNSTTGSINNKSRLTSKSSMQIH
jgi:hypothetical protein